MKSDLLKRLAGLFKIHFTPISQTKPQIVLKMLTAVNHHMTLIILSVPSEDSSNAITYSLWKIAVPCLSHVSKNTQAALRPHVVLAVKRRQGMNQCQRNYSWKKGIGGGMRGMRDGSNVRETNTRWRRKIAGYRGM